MFTLTSSFLHEEISRRKLAVTFSSRRPFESKDPPFLAIVSNRHSCDSDKNLSDALQRLKHAVSTNLVDLVSVRINVPDPTDQLVEERVVLLTRQLVDWSQEFKFRVVLSSDWRHLLADSGAHGVHVKEFQRECISEVRRENPGSLIGTSCHNVNSAMEAFLTYQVDYVYVGTCYMSDSHPEKGEDMLEGPALPGEVQREFRKTDRNTIPKVLAIGGIDASNCRVPIELGADGVAVIKSVLQSPDSGQAVLDIIENMTTTERTLDEVNQS